jgi:antitoxin component YwqK of YwqJK toxin-antitoxin module
MALAAAPILDCPPGTSLRGGAPPEQFEAWCEGKDAAGQPVREGPSRSWYDDGVVRTDERWAGGRRDGPFVEYHRNGTRAREGRYAADEKVGTWTLWYEQGGLEEVATFARNHRDGPFTSYYRTGKRRAEGRHCGGAQCGRWISWDEAGRELGRVEYGELRATP